MAFWPGSRREPEIIAAKVSTRCSFARSATSLGNGCFTADAICVLSVSIMGDTGLDFIGVGSRVVNQPERQTLES